MGLDILHQQSQGRSGGLTRSRHFVHEERGPKREVLQYGLTFIRQSNTWYTTGADTSQTVDIFLYDRVFYGKDKRLYFEKRSFVRIRRTMSLYVGNTEPLEKINNWDRGKFQLLSRNEWITPVRGSDRHGQVEIKCKISQTFNWPGNVIEHVFHDLLVQGTGLILN